MLSRGLLTDSVRGSFLPSLQDEGAVVEDEEEEEEQMGPHPDVDTTVLFTSRPDKGGWIGTAVRFVATCL